MALATPTLNSVTSINPDGSRRFIHPTQAHGRFTRWRSLTGLVLLMVYAGLPWIPINGNPAVFLDLLHRQFHLFGLTLVTQDLWLAFFIITGAGFSLFYATALFGRVWCGWACPLTVFLDIVRRVERWIEGDAIARQKLDTQKWTVAKIFKRGLKYAFYAVFALFLAHVFLSYFVSIPRLYGMMRDAPAAHWSAFLFVFLTATALWFNFAWFREQFCIILCPYGRLQSVLIDNHSLIVGYDVRRGEPRGKKGTEGAGACVDCRRCVQVCPTGIDIRQGLQMECIACAACVDVCDDIMDKLERPRGLIRYDSLNGFSGLKTKLIRPRTLLYTVLLLVGAGVMATSVSTFRPVTVSLLRMTGSPYFLDQEKHIVRNQFILRVLNKRNQAGHFHIELIHAPEHLHWSGAEEGIPVEALGEAMRPLVALLPQQDFHGEFPLTIHIKSDDGKVIIEKVMPFLGPE